MGLFSSKKMYAAPWQVSGMSTIKDEDVSDFKSAKVVPSDYGTSICLFAKSGGMKFMPLSNTSTGVNVGDEFTPEELVGHKVITLSRDGSDDIERIEIKR